MTLNSAYEGSYQKAKAVWLKAGPYEAAVLPELGANLIAFRDTEKQYQFLREPSPKEWAKFRKTPTVHGIPVLFPPNRYEDGKFPWNGKVHELPVNEVRRNNHLHGFLYKTPWKVTQFGADDTGASVTLEVKVAEGHPVYALFPFSFTFRLKYTLSEDGLQQQVFIRNDGEERMPCLLAFHTAVRAPFAPNAANEDMRIKLTIGERWAMSKRMLPTGQFQPLKREEEAMKGDGVSPFFAALDNHYTAVPQNGRNRMELTDTKNNVTLVYDAGTAYKQWMIWNNKAVGGYFCPEPQINLVNAPHVDLPADEIGLVSLEKGEIWEETSRFYVV